MKTYFFRLFFFVFAISFSHADPLEKCRSILPDLIAAIQAETDPDSPLAIFNRERAKNYLRDLDQSKTIENKLAYLFEIHDQSVRLMQLQNLIEVRDSELDFLMQSLSLNTERLLEYENKIGELINKIREDYPDLFEPGNKTRLLTTHPWIIVESHEKDLELVLSDLIRKKILHLGSPIELSSLFGIVAKQSPHFWATVAQLFYEISNRGVNPPLQRVDFSNFPAHLLQEKVEELEFLYNYIWIQRHKALRETFTEDEKKRTEKSFLALLNDLELRIKILKSKNTP